MTEEKELLLKYLCAALPYGVIVDYKENEFELPHWKITTIHPETLSGWIGYDRRVGAGSESGSRHFKIGDVKPYLRPMSSMTQEEATEYANCGNIIAISHQNDYLIPNPKSINWLLENHFDFIGLIEKGLALEAPEGIYKHIV